MALLTALVGSIGLTGTMGMNVLERTREIGVMRSIGAVDQEIMRTVIVEGMLIGSISWILGALLSFPITYLVIVHYQFSHFPLANCHSLHVYRLLHLAAGGTGAFSGGKCAAGAQCRPAYHPRSAGLRVACMKRGHAFKLTRSFYVLSGRYTS